METSDNINFINSKVTTTDAAPAFAPIADEAAPAAEQTAAFASISDAAATTAFSPVAEEMRQAEEETAAAFTPVHESAAQEAFVEQESVFAEGLPAWDIVPPQTVVRRR